jgi:anti-anti-sigma factor
MTVRHQDAVTILTPSGNLFEGDESDALERALHGVFERGATHVRVNLCETSHLSARALGVLAKAHLEASARGGHLEIATCREEHVYLFEITGLAGVFDVKFFESPGRGGLQKAVA